MFSMLKNKEEEIMQIVWKLKKAFVKDILEEIANKKQISDELKKKMSEVIQKFTESFKK